MGVLDIVLGIPLLYAAYKGFHEGIVVQLGGILALIIGIYLAFHYGTEVGNMLGINENLATVTGFIIIVLAVLICMAIIGKILSGLFRFAGLGLFDQIGGVLLSIIKMAIILSVLLMAFETINEEKHWVTKEAVEQSVLYKPLRDVSDLMFPYIDFIKDKLL